MMINIDKIKLILCEFGWLIFFLLFLNRKKNFECNYFILKFNGYRYVLCNR